MNKKENKVSNKNIVTITDEQISKLFLKTEKLDKLYRNVKRTSGFRISEDAYNNKKEPIRELSAEEKQKRIEDIIINSFDKTMDNIIISVYEIKVEPSLIMDYDENYNPIIK